MSKKNALSKSRVPLPKVLLIEDDELLGPLYTFLLEEQRIHVTRCVSQAEVLKVMRTASFDLILLDMMLPNTSGLELMPMLKHNAPQTKVIMLSNLHQPELQDQAFVRGAAAYLVKSELTPDVFIQHVQHFLSKD